MTRHPDAMAPSPDTVPFPLEPVTSTSGELALIVAMMTQPFRSNAERQAAVSKLQRIVTKVRRMEHALDEITADAEEQERTAASRVVPMRPVVVRMGGEG